MPYFEEVKYVYVCRDGLNSFLSLDSHYKHGNSLWYAFLNDFPGRDGPAIPRYDVDFGSTRALFDKWISQGWSSHPWESDGYPWWSLTHNIATWFEWRHLDNMLLVHFDEMKLDLPGVLNRLGHFLGAPVTEESIENILHKCSFNYMKAHATDMAPVGGIVFKGGAKAFFDKGSKMDPADVLTAEQIATYKSVFQGKLTAEAFKWLETGEKLAVDPCKVRAGPTRTPRLLVSSPWSYFVLAYFKAKTTVFMWKTLFLIRNNPDMRVPPIA